jgi:hypothetical protein
MVPEGGGSLMTAVSHSARRQTRLLRGQSVGRRGNDIARSVSVGVTQLKWRYFLMKSLKVKYMTRCILDYCSIVRDGSIFEMTIIE